MLLTEEQKRHNQLYLKWQKEYNKTGDKDILWNHIRPLLVDMIGNMAKKLCKGHYISDFEHRLEIQVDRVIKRYITHPQYNRDMPMTIAYWEAVNLLYSSSHDKLVGNFDHDYDYYNASYTTEEEKIVDVGGGNRLVMDDETKEFYFIKKGEKVKDVIKALCDSGWKYVD